MALGEMAEGSGARRATNSEINMVPMIDLLICSIAFLMLTAVWNTWGRIPADVAGAGSSRCGGCGEKGRPELHVTVRGGGAFALAWREGNTVLRTREVPRRAQEAGGRYPELARAIRGEWEARPAAALVHEGPLAAVLHVDAREKYGEMAAVMDAIQAPKLAPQDRRSNPAFYVRLSD